MVRTITCIECREPFEPSHYYAGHASCRQCISVKRKERYKATREKTLAVNAAYRANHATELKEKRKQWLDKNPTYQREYAADWSSRNRERRRKIQSKWKLENKYKVNENTARRYAQKSKAAPTWANQFFIDEIYELRALRSKLTGVHWHVDHIVPLRSKWVCGLHVDANLQILVAKENQSKSNKRWPDMW